MECNATIEIGGRSARTLTCTNHGRWQKGMHATTTPTVMWTDDAPSATPHQDPTLSEMLADAREEVTKCHEALEKAYVREGEHTKTLKQLALTKAERDHYREALEKIAGFAHGHSCVSVANRALEEAP